MQQKVVLFFPILEEGKDFHWPPISLLALAAVLNANNFECVIIDSRIEKDTDNRLRKELADALCLGITAFTGYSLKHALKAAKICRQVNPELPIFFGGPHATALPEQSKRSSLIDDVVVGYGEFEFLEKVQRLARGERYDIEFNRLDLHKKLASPDMPLIPYEIIDMKRYINPKTEAIIYLTSYGCPGKCTFCSTSTLARLTHFALKKVKGDLENLLKIHHFRHLVFYDATFFANIKRALEIAEYIQQYSVEWSADARTYEAVKLEPKMIEKLEETGLRYITIGLETGSQRIVNIMNKGNGHVERMYKIINNFSDSPISIASGIIFGVPGETIEDLKTTLKVIKELCSFKNNFKVSTTFFRPLPGTALYNALIKDYGYKFPQSIEEWADLGEKTHYQYNEAMDIPWFNKRMTKEYLKIYSEFWNENVHLLEGRGL
jgi:anaerobic magnesium-protoporphyrin IX monomethyl ester cyclase